MDALPGPNADGCFFPCPLLCVSPSQCTSKLDIPSFFEKKKGKTGPSRCCDSCRFKIVSGAKLVEKLSAQAMIAQNVGKKAQRQSQMDHR